MKRFTLSQLILCCGLTAAVTTGLAVWITTLQRHFEIDDFLEQFEADDSPIIDRNAYLLRKDTLYSDLPAPDWPNKRLVDQARLLEAYEKDPAAFVNKYQGEDRTYLFDAVIDAKNMIRMGRFGDGGKWLSDPQSLEPGTIVYSFGVGHDISFDVEMAGLLGCEVHAFDPGPSVQRSFADYHPGQTVGKGRFWYHPVGLGPTSNKLGKTTELVIEGQKCEVKRLSELAAELGHTRVDVLKIDIEGGEMPALTEILASGTLAKLSVKQILVECHFWNDDQWNTFIQIVGLLRQQGYLIFRKEFNPFNTSCAEFAFIGPY